MTQYLFNAGNVSDGITVKSGTAAVPAPRNATRLTRVNVRPDAETVQPNETAVRERRGITAVLRIPK